MTISLKYYNKKYWPDLKDFIREYWASDHPLLNFKLFDWQFKGFGNENGKVKFPLLFDNSTLVGMRGIIPGLYQIPLSNSEMKVVQGGSLSMWMIHPSYRGQKLGYKLHQDVQKNLPVLTGAGSRPATSVPIYKSNSFDILDNANRYYLPLSEKFLKLINNPDSSDSFNGYSSCFSESNNCLEPDSKVDLDYISNIWRNFSYKDKIFSLHRNTNFWRWRYIESPFNKYLFWVDPKGSGFVVGRLETLSPNHYEFLPNMKILRIIEIVPSESNFLRENPNDDFKHFICNILNWCRENDCIAADFYFCNDKFSYFLQSLGFKKQNPNSLKDESSIPVLFNPSKYVSFFNFLYRIEIESKSLIYPGFENSYFVKSDNDMDRPLKV